MRSLTTYKSSVTILDPFWSTVHDSLEEKKKVIYESFQAAIDGLDLSGDKVICIRIEIQDPLFRDKR